MIPKTLKVEFTIRFDIGELSNWTDEKLILACIERGDYYVSEKTFVARPRENRQ